MLKKEDFINTNSRKNIKLIKLDQIMVWIINNIIINYALNSLKEIYKIS